MTSDIVIFGAGALAQVLHAHLREDSRYRVAAFTATSDRISGASVFDCPLVPFETLSETHPPETHSMFIAVGYARMNRTRSHFYNAARVRGYELISYVAPTASVPSETKIGDNCCILDGTIIDPFVTLGNDVVVWGGGYVGHHSSIGHHSFLAPRVSIAGHVAIGAHCFLGINCTVRNGITIADNCLIGAGAVMLSDSSSGEVYIAARTKPYTGETPRFFE